MAAALRHLAPASAAITAALLLCACTTEPPVAIEQGQEVSAETATFTFSERKFDLFSEYRIVPGDQLDVLFSIQTWEKEASFHIALGDTVQVKFLNAPQYNEMQKVRPDGTISLPFIGAVAVAGQTVEGLQAALEQRYAQVFRVPALLVSVPEFLSQIRELKQDLHTSARGLSRLVTVRPDGYTTFPMVGDVAVGDRTIREVGEVLNVAYQRISPSLKVDLFLEKHSGSVVYVLGQVQRPGAYEIRRPLSVIEAIALAQGATPQAGLEQVVVLRRNQEKMVGTRVNVSDMLHLEKGAIFFYVSKDDIIYVPQRRSAATAQFMQEVMDVMMFRGWNVGISFGRTLDEDPVF